MTNREWRALMRWLRRRFPMEGTVTVVRRPIQDCADTRFDGRDFRIIVNSNQEPQGQVDSILHEWAHALAIEQAYKHDGPWSKLHGKIYEAWVKYNNET